MTTEQVVPRKIAFVGTSCIGKTTLLDHYRKAHSRNPKVAFVEEAARIFFTGNPDISDRFSAEVQAQVQAMTLRNEREAHSSE